MAARRKPYFPRLTGSAGLWQPQKPGFATLAQQTLGDAGSPADGADRSIADLFNAFHLAGDLLDAIARAGEAATAAQTAAQAIRLPDLDAAIAAATAAGSAGMAKLGAAMSLLGDIPQSPGPTGPAPLPPIVDIAGATGGPGSSGSNVFSEATYADITGVAAGQALQGLINAGFIGGQLAQDASMFIPVIGIAIGVGLILAHFLGHGCGAPCIEGSKAEQIYEAAADNLLKVYKLGMISLAQAVAGMVHLISAGNQHLASFNTPQANKGAANMQQVIQAEIRDAQVIPPPKRAPFDLAKARLDYISGPGWYPDSLAAAAELTDEYLQALTSAKGA